MVPRESLKHVPINIIAVRVDQTKRLVAEQGFYSVERRGSGL